MNTIAPQTVFEMREATFGYNGTAVVSGITARIAAGQAVALIGPNGSGKSTVLGALVGLTEHLSGHVQILGTTVKKARKNIGLLPQRDTRNVDMPVTAAQVVAMGLYRSLGLRPLGRNGRERVLAALDKVGLADRAKISFADLSGGQQQRVILARALVANPKLLLLDEPFNGLDRPNRQALLATIAQLREAGCAIVVSTHDLEIAREVCSHVMLLDRKLIAFGTVTEALTLENVAAAFHDTTVEIDTHSLTTRHEDAAHLHHEHQQKATDTKISGDHL